MQPCICLHPSVSLNNENICREFSEHKIAVREKTAGVRSGNSSDLNSACLKVLVPVEIFQFSDMHYETERCRDSTDGLINYAETKQDIEKLENLLRLVWYCFFVAYKFGLTISSLQFHFKFSTSWHMCGAFLTLAFDRITRLCNIYSNAT